DNRRVRRVDAITSIITTVAGGGNPLSGIGDGGSATSARLFLPTAVVVDTLGNLLIADAVHGRIRFVNLKTGIINSLAGGGNPEDGIGDDRPATDAAIEPMGLAVDGVGNIFIADMRSKTVRAVNAEGFITRVAGNGATNFGGDGQLAIAATLDTPNAVAIDRSGNIYIEDANNRRIRKIDASSLLISTVAGGGNPRDGLGDGGSPTDASFSIFGAIISGLVLDKDNNIIISDIFNARVRKIDFTGNRITTVAGNGQFSSTGESVPATEAAIGRPTGLAFDSQANLYIADTSENRPAIRRVSAADSRIQTVVGGGSRQSGDGLPATAVRLKSVASVAVDLDGNIYVVDPADSRVRRVDAKTGIIDAYAGDGGFGSSGDGGLAKDANLSFPISATVDSAGNLYISDIGTQSVRRVDAKTRIITTVAGIGVSGYIGDGSIATRAALADPAGLAVDSNGNLYIADSSNGAIRVVKGIGQQQIDIRINNVSFNKPQLLVSGAGFGNSGARVLINGQDLSPSISSQSDSSIVVKGNKKKLFLKKGANQITVTNSSNSSASFVFNF
ncbi:MAG: hypothetical protein JNN15_05400, partial [Blastocatellia bacterium]|nr:hypothetical protein [Blastocatellia bacterium]